MLAPGKSPNSEKANPWVRLFRRIPLLGPVGAVMLLLPLLSTRAQDSPAEATLLTEVKTAMGTRFTIRVWTPTSREADAEQAVEAAFSRIKRLEDRFTDYDPSSELMRLCQAPAGEAFTVSEDLFKILDLSRTLSVETGGAFDVTVGPLVRNWRLARKNGRLPEQTVLDEARRRSGFTHLSLDPSHHTVTLARDRMRLDLGGIAKGFAADAALTMLKERGFPRALVAASGDIALGDPPPGRQHWRVGIRSLDVALEPGKSPVDLTGFVEMANGAVSTSGDIEQWIEIEGVRYSHIVDPATGLGLTDRLAVTVVGPDATTTDSHATAASVLGPEGALNFVAGRPDVSALVFYLDEAGELRRRQSPDFPELHKPASPSPREDSRSSHEHRVPPEQGSSPR